MGDAPPSSHSSLKKDTTTYFGFGSNLWREQMHKRCPTSKFLGKARLRNYRWIINSRGYANVVELQSSNPNYEVGAEDIGSEIKSYTDEVWGLVYSLQPDDEARLDVNEGVPDCYTKEWLKCEFWSESDGGSGSSSERESKPEKVDMLVYIDRERTEPDKPKKEYIHRMNQGIEDALEAGVPRGYIKEVVRKFIPDVRLDKEVIGVAEEQAERFDDGR